MKTIYQRIFDKLEQLVGEMNEIPDAKKCQVPGFMDLSLDRLHADGGAIALHCRHVRLLAQRGDLIGRHPRAHVPARNVHALRPVLVKNLGSRGDHQIDRDVLRSRHVPEQPHDRVEAVARALSHVRR